MYLSAAVTGQPEPRRNNSTRDKPVRGDMRPQHLVLYKMDSRTHRYGTQNEIEIEQNIEIGTRRYSLREKRVRGEMMSRHLVFYKMDETKSWVRVVGKT